MEKRRLYTLGDALQEAHDDALLAWKHEHARSMTTTAAREKKLNRVEVEVQYTFTGVAWIHVTISGKRIAWSHSSSFKLWLRPDNMFEFDAQV